MLRDNLAAMGQQQPIVVVKVGEQYFGTDGLHRWQMARERGDATVPCVVREGEEKDVFMSNLVLNSLRGRTKASEQVAVMGELFHSMDVSIEELTAKTGHSREWVERMITVSGATPMVRQVLDDELITLGHAYALARVEDPAMQERICHQLLTYRWSIKDLEKHIKDSLAISREPAPQPNDPTPRGAAGMQCAFCHQERESRMVQMLAVCVSCGGALLDGLHAQATVTANEH
jgi:ParB family chromosome partitioning protein